MSAWDPSLQSENGSEWKSDQFRFSFHSRVTSLNANDSQSLSFCKGLKLLESGCVENVLQVGKLNNTSEDNW